MSSRTSARSSSELNSDRVSGASQAVERSGAPAARGNRLLQADEIARAGGAERRACDEALEILHALQHLAELAAVGAAEGELLDGVQPIADAVERDERPEQPGAQQPAGHRR